MYHCSFRSGLRPGVESEAFGAKWSENDAFHQTARYGIHTHDRARPPNIGTLGQHYHPAPRSSKTSSRTTVPDTGTTVPSQNHHLINPFSKSLQSLPSTIGTHDHAVARHGRATSETFERGFSQNGSKHNMVNNRESGSVTCQARPCQKVAWLCHLPSSLNTSLKLICKGVGAFW
ncbi:hypothetical protein HanPI659440_Chr17g0696181 [Helianthus annuus]|nr:hypothetical protein HanPI659440_Chr17g0696181 [Helianthus annuus]